MGHARWMIAAKDLTATPGEAVNYLTVGELSDATGLAPGTINDSITRAAITNTNNPRSAICRPAARIGDVPLWSKEQRAKFLAIREAQENAATTLLEAVSADHALKHDLYSLVEYADMFGVHDQTLRRAQSQDGDFPPAVARRCKDAPGVPEHLFKLGPMQAWAENKGYAVREDAVAAQS